MMKAVHIAKYGVMPSLASLSIPRISNKDEYLIKMAFAPINPSDVNFYCGFYGFKKEKFPIMGFEGSGVIVESLDSHLKGRKVSVLANQNNGTFSTHLLAQHQDLIIWPQNTTTTLENIAMACINPLSCIGLCEIVIRNKAKSVLLSAATSNVNHMIIRYLRKTLGNTISIFGISRSSQYDEELLKLGVTKMFRMEDQENLKKELSTKTVFLDCIGGTFAGKTFNLLPKDSIMVNYGRLSKENLNQVDLGQLYFANKSIRGFWLNTFLSQIDSKQLNELKQKVIQNVQIFEQKIREVQPLEKYVSAIKESIKNQSEGKILLQLN